MKSPIIVAVLCVILAYGMPQQLIFPDNVNSVSSTTSAPAPTVTTDSPRYLACIRLCPATSEYNPICGTDNQNYYNGGRLSCAQMCGKNVAAVRSGMCASG